MNRFQEGGQSQYADTGMFDVITKYLTAQQSQDAPAEETPAEGEQNIAAEDYSNQDYTDLQDRYTQLEERINNIEAGYGSYQGEDQFMNFLFNDSEDKSPFDSRSFGAVNGYTAAPNLEPFNNQSIPSTGTKNGFQTFATPEAGRAALERQLMLYQTGKTKNPVKPNSTLLEAMSIYAPSSDNNNPQHYAKFIADKIGVSVNTPISQIDTKRWADAITQMEGNKVGNNPGNLRPFKLGGEIDLIAQNGGKREISKSKYQDMMAAYDDSTLTNLYTQTLQSSLNRQRLNPIIQDNKDLIENTRNIKPVSYQKGTSTFGENYTIPVYKAPTFNPDSKYYPEKGWWDSVKEAASDIDKYVNNLAPIKAFNSLPIVKKIDHTIDRWIEGDDAEFDSLDNEGARVSQNQSSNLHNPVFINNSNKITANPIIKKPIIKKPILPPQKKLTRNNNLVPIPQFSTKSFYNVKGLNIDVNLGEIPKMPYRVEYNDGTGETHRSFITQEQSNQFADKLSNRRLNGIPANGNITQRVQFQGGGRNPIYTSNKKPVQPVVYKKPDAEYQKKLNLYNESQNRINEFKKGTGFDKSRFLTINNEDVPEAYRTDNPSVKSWTKVNYNTETDDADYIPNYEKPNNVTYESFELKRPKKYKVQEPKDYPIRKPFEGPIIKGTMSYPDPELDTSDKGAPVFGPANSLIGHWTDGQFYPANGAPGKVNKADVDLQNNPEALNKYLRQKGLPAMQNGGQVRSDRDLAASMRNGSDTPIIPLYDQKKISEEDYRKFLLSQQSKASQAKNVPLYQQKINNNKKALYAQNQPNAVLNSNGNLSRINQNVSMEGVPNAGSPEERQAKGMEHALTALEVAGDLEGVGALAKGAWGALKGSRRAVGELAPELYLNRSAGKEPFNLRAFSNSPLDKSTSFSANQPFKQRDIDWYHQQTFLNHNKDVPITTNYSGTIAHKELNEANKNRVVDLLENWAYDNPSQIAENKKIAESIQPMIDKKSRFKKNFWELSKNAELNHIDASLKTLDDHLNGVPSSAEDDLFKQRVLREYNTNPNYAKEQVARQIELSNEINNYGDRYYTPVGIDTKLLPIEKRLAMDAKIRSYGAKLDSKIANHTSAIKQIDINPAFESKIKNLYELAGKEAPTTIKDPYSGITNTTIRDKTHVVYPKLDEQAIEDMSMYTKDEINKSFTGNTGGFRNNTGTYTYGLSPDDITYQAKYPIINEKVPFKLTSPSTWSGKKTIPVTSYKPSEIIKNIKLTNVSPNNVVGTLGHEGGHDLQKMGDWGTLMDKWDDKYKYFTTHGENPLSKTFQEHLISPSVDDNYKTWLSGGKELHSDLMSERIKILMDLDPNPKKAVEMFRKNEDMFNENILNRGKLTKFFKPETPDAIKKSILKIMPVATGVVAGGAVANSASGQSFQYGGADVSRQGYNFDSPYRNEKELLINTPTGEITMENTHIPLLGIDNLGNKKVMKPGGKYKFEGTKVKEMPLQMPPMHYQTGGPNRSISEDTTKKNDYQTFYNNYMNSEEYTKRLTTQGYADPAKTIADRMASVNNTGFSTTTGRSNSINGNIEVNPQEGSVGEIAAHEYSHKGGSGPIDGNPNLTMNQNELDMLNNLNRADKRANEHIKNPYEAKADLDALRFLMKDIKKPDTPTTIEDLNKARQNPIINKSIIDRRLKKRYKDDDLLKLLNSLATNQTNNISTAKYGV